MIDCWILDDIDSLTRTFICFSLVLEPVILVLVLDLVLHLLSDTDTITEYCVYTYLLW